MKKTSEIVQKIKSCYVEDDCIQIMVPYKDEITILSQDDILFHYKKILIIILINIYKMKEESSFLIQIYPHIIQE